MRFIGDDGDIEEPCEHGIGHPVGPKPPDAGPYWGTHTCDLCCTKEGWNDGR